MNNDTRWNSTYLMISRALVKQGDIRAFLVHPEVDKWLPEAGMLKGDDWRLLAAGMDILRTGIESIDSFDAKSYEYRIERAQAFDRKSIDLVERVTRFAETHARLVLASLLEPVNRPLAVPDATERDLSS
jgi:hypothetical protein